MHAILYISQAIPKLTLSEIIRMLEQAKQFNRSHEISGCILYHKQTFIQLIEGRKEEICRLYDRIRNDTRHKRVTTLFDGPIKDRVFSRWAMIFYEFSGGVASLNYKRLLFETYLEEARLQQGNDEVYYSFCESSSILLRDGFQDIFDVVEELYPATKRG